MAVVVDEQQALDHLVRACLQQLADAADAGRLRSAESRAAVGAIIRGLLHQASGAIANPIEARRAVEGRMEIVQAVLDTIAADQDDGRQVQVEAHDHGDPRPDLREGRGS
jgi:hypothetical protein